MDSEQSKRFKELNWIGSSKKDLKTFPEAVKNALGQDLWTVQIGGKPDSAKVLKGFGGAEVLELVDDYDSDTYRVVYTIRFKREVYVLHAFQKKSKHGIKTSQNDMAVVKARLRLAAEDYARRYPND